MKRSRDLGLTSSLRLYFLFQKTKSKCRNFISTQLPNEYKVVIFLGMNSVNCGQNLTFNDMLN